MSLSDVYRSGQGLFLRRMTALVVARLAAALAILALLLLEGFVAGVGYLTTLLVDTQ